MLTDNKPDRLYLHSSTNHSKEQDWKVKPSTGSLGVLNDDLKIFREEVWKYRESESSVLKTTECMQNWQGEFSCFNPDVFISSKREETSMKIYKGSENVHNKTLERKM